MSFFTDSNVKVLRKKPGSPAVTLEIGGDGVLISLDMVLALKVKQSWPGSTINGLKIEEWLGTKVRTDFRRKSFYLVPKQQPLETTEGAQALSKKGALSLPFKEQMHEQNICHIHWRKSCKHALPRSQLM